MILDNSLKNKIDKYFENISAEDLYSILTKQYDFEKICIQLTNGGKYQNIDDRFSSIYRQEFSYVSFSKNDNKPELESIKTKFVEDCFEDNSTIAYNKESTIPFAA